MQISTLRIAVVVVAAVGVLAAAVVIGQRVAAGFDPVHRDPGDPSPTSPVPSPATAEQPAPTAPDASAAPTTQDAATPQQPTTVLWVAPDSDGSGSSEDDPADLAAVTDVAADLPPGAEIRLLGHRGPYELGESITLRAGGTAEQPLWIRGWPPSGAPAEIVGDRAAPYSSEGATGGEAFRLLSGADHVSFTDLHLRDVGTAFRVAHDIADLRVTDVAGTNVRRFLDTNATEEGGTATISGLLVQDVAVEGFSKGVLRLGYDTHDVLIQDVVGDSQRQDGDNFAVGVHLTDTVHDVVLRRVTMNNAHDTLHDYWNGDGFAIERDVRGVRFEQTSASGNTDAGYDLKGTDIVMDGVRATDNKRNFRFWGEVVLRDCVGADPRKRGGVGTQAQVHLGDGADVLIEGCTFTDDSDSTIVFDLDGEPSAAEVRASTVQRAPGSTLQSVVAGASLTLDADVHDRAGGAVS